MLYWIGYFCAWLISRICFRLRVIGRENFRGTYGEGVILACNHTSYLDPELVGVAYRKKVVFLARKTLFRTRLRNWILRKFNAIPVDQERPDFSSLRTIIRKLCNDKSVVIFPEGERSEDGLPKSGEAGVGLVIAKSKARVVPMRLFGAFEAYPKGAKKIRFKKITLVVGKPISFSDVDLSTKGRKGYQALSDQVMDAIKAIEMPAGSDGRDAGAG